MKKLILLSALAAFYGSHAYAQQSASATGTAKVKIVKPIAISEQRQLNFGAVYSDSDGGTITIANSSAGTPTFSGLAEDSASGETPASGHFSITAEGARSYNISVDSTVTLSGTGSDMTATLSPSATSASGDSDLYVGGVLTVAGNQAAGDYTGTYNVTVAY